VIIRYVVDLLNTKRSYNDDQTTFVHQ